VLVFDFAISIAFGETESARTSTRPIEKLPVSNGAGFITLSGPEKRYKTSKPPRVTKYDQEPEFTENIAGVPLTLSKDVLELWLLASFDTDGEVRNTSDSPSAQP
jgi:hypothetical protein